MSTIKTFASAADTEEKKVTFKQISDHAWAYTAEGDPNTGIVIGDDAVLVADTQATPAMAADVIRRIREVTDKPIKYVVLTHYHAVRVLGASAYQPQQILASQDTYDLIAERGEQDKASEIGRFPRLFQNLETVPAGLTWPTMTFTGKMTIWLGKLAPCCPVTWSNSMPRPMPVMLISKIGRKPSTTLRPSTRWPWCLVVVLPL
jgi:glyoxylase-like metal-dependent hydrolase (beta-lactamase superfamily II)